MPMPGSVRVFIACSLDGFVAGPDDDLSWLPEPQEDDHGFGAFLEGISALLMGRATYRVLEGFGGEWPFGKRPVFVATTRPLEQAPPTVHAVAGTPAELLTAVREVTDGDVYLDGGDLIRQFLDEGLVDRLIVTIVPFVLGAGAPLFAGIRHRRKLELDEVRELSGGLVQLEYRPV
jgi:dihydrofolate reductase